MAGQGIALSTHAAARIRHPSGIARAAVIPDNRSLTYRCSETSSTNETVMHGKHAVLPPIGVFVPRRIGHARDHLFSSEPLLERFEHLVSILDVETGLSCSGALSGHQRSHGIAKV